MAAAGDADLLPPRAAPAPPAKTQINMVAYGAAICCQLGRVAVAGSDRKQPGAGALWLWDWDPCEFVTGLAPAAGGGGSVLSPRVGRWSSDGVALAAAVSPDGSERGGGGVRRSDDGAGTPSSGGSGGDEHGGGDEKPAGSAAEGLLAKRENPLKIVSAPEGGPLLCVAWAASGGSAVLVAGSSGGWVVVVNLTKHEDDAQVRFGVGLLHACRLRI